MDQTTEAETAKTIETLKQSIIHLDVYQDVLKNANVQAVASINNLQSTISELKLRVSETTAAWDDQNKLIDLLQKEIRRLNGIIEKISGLVSGRHGDNDLYCEEYSDDDDLETGTIKLIFDVLDEFDSTKPNP